MDEQKVRAIMIVEIAGSPAQHIKNVLTEHVGKLKNVKDIEVFSIEVMEPKEIEGKKGFYTTFAEVEFATKNFRRMFDVMFDFMPSSIEIVEPSNVEMSMEEATTLLNNITGRLHRYDDIAKLMKARELQMVSFIEKQKKEIEELKNSKTKNSGKKTSKKSGKKKNNKK